MMIATGESWSLVGRKHGRHEQALHLPSSTDDGFVRALREGLEDLGYDGWIDSRQLRGGDLLWPEIEKAIDEASGLAVVVSPDSLQSKWVGRELRHALEVQKTRGNDRFPVIPVSLDGTKLGVLEQFFGEEPVYIPAASAAGGDDAVLDAILVAMGKRLPVDRAAEPQPKAEPVEELVLRLTDLRVQDVDGKRRATARARLVYEPATPGQPAVVSQRGWSLRSPLEPIDAKELRWYLEKYAIWPTGIFRDRALNVEKDLEKWGQLLHQVAMPAEHTDNVLQAWARIDDQTERRFSVYVDSEPEADATEADGERAREAATLLLGLPWEILHDGRSFLFQGGKPVRVRRRLPNTEIRDALVVATPIRVLLIVARPEDTACDYINHRASALPLVHAMEALGGVFQMRTLDPPTLPALAEELDRARRTGQRYHVIHFDGHGVFDRHLGRGGLCFEDPQDQARLENRRHKVVFADELGPILRDHRIPLMFLEACETATADGVAESFATAVLKQGVGSVVAMSHSVLVETSRRFVEAFYGALAAGNRVGSAMLAGQRTLKNDSGRGRIFGAGELCLQDWFVPVLYQEKDDPQLFKRTLVRQTRDDILVRQKRRMGDLPERPKTGFVGRSRELLALQRLLANSRYAVIRGQGGEGKTALATEFARWMVSSRQVRRAAFVCVEGMEKNIVESVLDRLGQQLCKQGWSTQADCGGDREKAEMAIERALKERPTLLVVDNMESILPPPFVERHEALVAEAKADLDALLDLCQRLSDKGDTRIVFTSRELLPAPFDGERERRELGQLACEDAVELVEKLLGEDAAGAGDAVDARTEEIELLVDAVHCHARTLSLLAPSLRSQGVEATRESLAELMAEMDRRFPGDREKSVYASVELSLRRLSPTNREKARILAVFHGGANLVVLRVMMERDEPDALALARELTLTGLAKGSQHNHLSFDPALCPYLREATEPGEIQTLTDRWGAAMRPYVAFLAHLQAQQPDVAARLTALELPNFLVLLELVERSGDAEATIQLATSLFSLLQFLGRARPLECVTQARDRATRALGEAWNHSHFEAHRTRIEQQLDCGQLREAVVGARALIDRARVVGGEAYRGADFDLAGACWLQGCVFRRIGKAEDALRLFEESYRRFTSISEGHLNLDAERMASVCVSACGDCLLLLGRFDQASEAYEDCIRRAEELSDKRQLGVARASLGTALRHLGRFDDARSACQLARALFTELNEPVNVAGTWHQEGRVYEDAGQPEAAEDAYRESLAISTRLGNRGRQADTVLQLGILYKNVLDRSEEAATLLTQAAGYYAGIPDRAREGKARINLADCLRGLSRLDEARLQTRATIDCVAPFGHASEPWKAWTILAAIEAASGNLSAAAEAKQTAIDCYLAYRRDGGENHYPDGRLVFAMTEQLAQGGLAAATAFIQQFAAQPDIPAPFRPFIQALQAVLKGSRDRSLANAPDLDYTMAAEILLLIETLDRPNVDPSG